MARAGGRVVGRFLTGSPAGASRRAARLGACGPEPDRVRENGSERENSGGEPTRSEWFGRLSAAKVEGRRSNLTGPRVASSCCRVVGGRLGSCVSGFVSMRSVLVFMTLDSFWRVGSYWFLVFILVDACGSVLSWNL